MAHTLFKFMTLSRGSEPLNQKIIRTPEQTVPEIINSINEDSQGSFSDCLLKSLMFLGLSQALDLAAPR